MSARRGLSSLVSLATSMHSQPGVYAVLLGSGVSTGAGLLTGWGVVTELVARVAAASAPDDAGAVAAARADPELWWSENGEGELGYSSLLEQLAPSAAARQGLLAGFFEPGSDDETPVRQPSMAHRAIAELVRRGSVKVIVTTNFDRLMEQALDAAGVSPQVISRPEAVNGMAPLAHSSATVIKLHGDYRDLGTRNTPAELSEYPVEWTGLLEQVFDEYGLIVSGWSADWDVALVGALEQSTSRRYPLYWDQRSSRGESAKRLLAGRGGIVLPASNADDLFGELVESLEALDRLSAPPLTTAMAVARLKRYLPDPVRRIDLHDFGDGRRQRCGRRYRRSARLIRRRW
ncbi:SIR2 family protein [Microbacterium lacticum]